MASPQQKFDEALRPEKRPDPSSYYVCPSCQGQAGSGVRRMGELWKYSRRWTTVS